jgi:hypothetical protein
MRKPVPPETVERILRLDAEGWSQQRIADNVGLRRETVQRLLHRIHDKVFDRLIGRLAATRSRHIAKLEHAADLAMQAFTGSDKPTASFLTEYRGALADVRSILGIGNQVEQEGMPGAGSPEVTEALVMIANMRPGRGDDNGQDDDGQSDDGPDDQGGGKPPEGPQGGGPPPPYNPIAPWLCT